MQRFQFFTPKTLSLAAMVLALGLSPSHGALSFGAGLKGGVNFGNAAVENAVGDEVDVDAGRAGLALGGFAEFGVTSPFSLLVEALYTQTGIDDDVNGNVKLSQLEFPILLKAKFGRKDLHAYAFAGPNIGFNLSAEGSLGNVAEVETDDFTAINFAGDIGVGASVRLSEYIFGMADVRYSHGFTSIVEDEDALGKYNTRDIKLMLGVLFHLTE